MNKDKEEDKEKEGKGQSKLGKDEGEKQQEQKKGSGKGERKELTWTKNRTLIETFLTTIGFRQGKSREKEMVFGADVEGSEKTLFISFKDSITGSSWIKDKNIDKHNLPKYRAWKAFQKGNAKLGKQKPEEGYVEVIIYEDDEKDTIKVPVEKSKRKKRRKRQTSGEEEHYVIYKGEIRQIEEQFISDIHGRDYPNIEGILGAAHSMDAIDKILTNVIQYPTKILPDSYKGNDGKMHRPDDLPEIHEVDGIDSVEDYMAIVRATVVREDGRVFHGTGEAHPLNMTPRMVSSVIRMAETRAVGRALRNAFGVTTVAEEIRDIGGEEEGNEGDEEKEE